MSKEAASSDAGKSPAANEVRITLSRPIKAHDEDRTELVFREPTGADVQRYGDPVLIDLNAAGRPPVSFNTPAMSAMIAALAGIPPSSVSAMTAADWKTAAWAIAPFFIPDLPQLVGAG